MVGQDSFILRMLMVMASMVSLLVSGLVLLFFIIPHVSWMPLVPDWQEIGPNFLSQLHKETDWQPDDENLLLLVSVTNFVGSIGYDRSSFYTSVFPYWSSVLAFISLFCVLMVLASLLLLWYLTCNYKLSLHSIPIPWVVLQAFVFFVMVIGLIVLLSDLDSPSRIKMEQKLGEGNYSMLITVMIITNLYLITSIQIAFFHMEDRIMEMLKLDIDNDMADGIVDSFSV